MKTARAWLLLIAACLVCAPVLAAGPVTLKGHLDPADARAGEAAAVVVAATIEKPWHIYSTTPREGLGPKSTEISLVPGKVLTEAGKVVQPKPKVEHDPGFNIDVEIYEEKVEFKLPVKLAAGLSGAQKATVKIKYQACQNGSCLPPKTVEVPVEFKVAAGAARPDHQKPITGASAETPSKPTAAAATTGDVADQIKQSQKHGLLAFIWLAIGAGFLALLTPCVFPMVPITVSFFSKQHEGHRGEGVQAAIAYCLGIIGTFTALGLIVSLVFGASGLQALATNPWVNLGLALLFAFLALNLFGVYELILPATLVEKAQAGSSKGRFLGPMAMGLAFTLTSFTCTVPFVGTLLASTTQGNILWPVVGMLAFSSAFALPFFLLALFPGWLAKMPKAGGWLVTVKAFMGFVELAAALKFLSSAEVQWRLGLLTRPVFLAVWFAIAAVAACYMLGWLRLSHDHGALQIGWPRRIVGVLTLVAGIYCLAGINGTTLGALSAFLPPRDYGLRTMAGHRDVPWTEDYDAALAQAKTENKLVFLNFTGINCGNCRVIEDNVLTKPSVIAELKKLVPVELYTDKGDTRSDKYQRLEQEQFQQVSTPLYAVITPDGTKIDVTAYKNDYVGNPDLFAQFLREAQTKAAQAKPESVASSL